MTINPRGARATSAHPGEPLSDIDAKKVAFAQLGSELGEDFLTTVTNRATFNAIMGVVQARNRFNPIECRNTIGDLFEGASRVRVGHVLTEEDASPIIEADFAFFAHQTIANRRTGRQTSEIPLEARVEFAERWIAWGRLMRADAIRVEQAYRGGRREFVYGGPGSDPACARVWWD